MSNKLQVLTDKIYQEGVEKGNEEALKLTSAAKLEAEAIIKEANKEAAEIVAKAKAASQELHENTISEIKLSSSQAINAIKQEIANTITDTITSPDIKSATTNQDYIQSLIATAIKSWASGGDVDMSILVPEGTKVSVDNYFTTTAKGVLDGGFTIESANDVKCGFQVAAKDGSYKVSFTDEDFISFFKEFVRPKVATLLFE